MYWWKHTVSVLTNVKDVHWTGFMRGFSMLAMKEAALRNVAVYRTLMTCFQLPTACIELVDYWPPLTTSTLSSSVRNIRVGQDMSVADVEIFPSPKRSK